MLTPEQAVVVLPTFDEAQVLEATVASIRSVMPEIEILIVDDASPDGTGRIADRLAEGDPYLSVLHRTSKRGLGRAYLAAFQRLLADPQVIAVIEMDADGSHDARDLPALLGALDASDLAIGSRYVAGGRTEGWSPWRERLSRAGNAYARWALRLPIRDATSGFRAYRRSMLAVLDLGTVASEGYGFQVELAWRTWLRGGTIVEVPICFTERRAGASKMSRGIVLEALMQITRWGLARERPETLMSGPS